MPLWRDPFDELIADLDRSVPASAAPDFDMPPPMEDVCFFGEWMQCRDPERRQRLAENPSVRRVREYYDRLGLRLRSPQPRGTEDPGPSTVKSRSQPEG